MSALAKIEAYLTEKFASHNVAELMGHLEAAIKAEVEAAIAEVRAEVEKLRADIAAIAPAPTSHTIAAPGGPISVAAGVDPAVALAAVSSAAAEQAAEPASAPSAPSAK